MRNKKDIKLVPCNLPQFVARVLGPEEILVMNQMKTSSLIEIKGFLALLYRCINSKDDTQVLIKKLSRKKRISMAESEKLVTKGLVVLKDWRIIKVKEIHETKI